MQSDDGSDGSSTAAGAVPATQPLWHSSPRENFTCNQYVRVNSTFIVYGGYEGVPMNLGVNALGWLSLIVLFSLLRKNAWNYGRLALVHKNERRWIQLFYGNEETGHRLRTRFSWPSESPHAGDPSSTDRGGTFSWIVALFNIKDSDILHKCGSDAVQYLSFQRHIICYLLVVMCVAIGIVLPVNYYGHQRLPDGVTGEGVVTDGGGGNDSSTAAVMVVQGRESFARTTITNLAPHSAWLWLHATLALLFLPLAVCVMRRFSSRLAHVEAGSAQRRYGAGAADGADISVSSGGGGGGGGGGGSPAAWSQRAPADVTVVRSLMVTNIPRIACNRNTFLRHFQEAYPSLVLTDVQFCYNISRLMELDRQRDAAFQARVYSDELLAVQGRRLTVRPYVCGNVCCCCTTLCRCPEVDAIEHYMSEESRLSRQVEIEKVAALNQPLGIAFLVFQTAEMAKLVLREHDRVLRCGQCPPASSVSQLLKPYRWQVRFASPPGDIYWQNLNHSSFWWYFRSVLVNVLLFLVLFFLTTPIIVANAVEKLWITDQVKATSPLVSEFLPTLLLWTLAALMPVLVSFTDRFIYHWTRSSQNYSIMMKSFIFLLFMVLILPSLGLNSARALVEWMAHSSNETRWDCVFMPDNGAFFVNYVITSAFIGTSLELIRFPELFMYAFHMCLARSQAEMTSVRSAILWEFPFGVQYAWMLLIFAITVVYSLLYPLIAPFGLLYVCFKHQVDKHNIYYAYGASRIKRRIHTTAINFVMLSVCMTQLCLCLFTYSRQAFSPLTVFSLAGFGVTLTIFLGHVFFHWFAQCAPVHSQHYTEMIDSGSSGGIEAGGGVSEGGCSTVSVPGGGGAGGGEAAEMTADYTFVPSVLLRAPQVRVRDSGGVVTYPTVASDGTATGALAGDGGGGVGGGCDSGATVARDRSYGTHRPSAGEPHSLD